MLIQSKRSRRKRDPFAVLLLFVVLGMCVTIGYQFALYSGAVGQPIATRSAPPVLVGG